MLKSRPYCGQKCGASFPLFGVPVLPCSFCWVEQKHNANVCVSLKICIGFLWKGIEMNRDYANVLGCIYWKQVCLSKCEEWVWYPHLSQNDNGENLTMLGVSGVCSPTGQSAKMGVEGKNRIGHTQWVLGKMTGFELVWNKAESSGLEEEGCSLGFDKLCIVHFWAVQLSCL